MAADFDGDGRPDIAVFRSTKGNWYICGSRGGFVSVITHQWGRAADIPMAADYDGDGHVDLAVYRRGTGEWFIRYWSLQGY